MRTRCDDLNVLEDRLAVVACIVDDCRGLVEIGDEVRGIIWRRVRDVILGVEAELDPWRALPLYWWARAEIRKGYAPTERVAVDD